MSALFVALGIMVLALLALLLWFVPHLLHQQAARVAGETAQLREMLLDLLNEQESVAMRQTQLSSSLVHLQSRIEAIAQIGSSVQPSQLTPEAAGSIHQLEARLGDLQSQIQLWAEGRQRGAQQKAMQDNEAWANLMGLLAAIQDRVGALSKDRATAMAAVQATHLLQELEREMQNLRTISEDISTLQQRLRRSFSERDVMMPPGRQRQANGVEAAPYLPHP
jgi:cell division protein ZapA (FtsZ GTPase activity inhibitor)